MKKNYSKNLGYVGLLFLLLFFGTEASAQTSFLISFDPDPPAALTTCETSAPLKVKMSVVSDTSVQSADVTVELAPGVEYISNSVVLASSSAGITIAENGGTPNKPIFKINKTSALKAGDNISFQIQRRAVCASSSYQNLFTDKVIGAIQGYISSEKASAPYQVLHPVFTFSQPAAQTNSVLNKEYTRTFSVVNGGNGSTSNIYLTIDNPNGGIVQTAVSLNVNGTQVVITPISVTGTKSLYHINSAMLPNGKLSNGDKLVFTETYKIKTCGASTNYSVGWGCSSEPSSWCETKTGIGSTSSTTGVPNLTEFYIGATTGYVDACTNFTIPFRYTNGGTGDKVAAGMYDVNLRMGGSSTAAMGSFDWSYYNIVSAQINGKNIPVANGASYGIASFNLKDFFTADPDGAGVGLEDLDGDGFFDDLPAGQSVNLVLTFKINCGYYTSCNANDRSRMQYGVYGDVQYRTMCSSTLVTSTKNTGTGPGAKRGLPGDKTLGNTLTSGISNTSYVPANIYDGIPFNARFSVAYTSINNPFDSDKTRYVYEIELPPGVNLNGAGNLKYYYGSYPNGGIASATLQQNGNIITITPTDQRIGYVTLDLVYTCGTGKDIAIPFKVKRLDNIATGCVTCNAELFCDKLTLQNVLCPSVCPDGGASITFTKVERADNSLGWADPMLTKLQTRNMINAYDLSRAYYLDDIEVVANGIQRTTQNNLALTMSLAKLKAGNETGDILLPKQLEVTIKRGGNIIKQALLTTQFTSNSTATEQTIVWDITSILPNGQILDGDIFETKATYQVITKVLPIDNTQTGKSIYFSNTDQGKELRCNLLIPEMYLVGFDFSDTQGAALNVQSCTSTPISTGTNYYYLAPNTTATNNGAEYRPSMLPKTYQVTVPDGYILDKIEIETLVPARAKTDITNALVKSGNTYTYTFPDEYHVNVFRTRSSSLTVQVYLKGSCATPVAAQQLNTKLTYLPYYYYFKKNNITPQASDFQLADKNLPVTYDQSTKPAIKITNLSGEIQASKPTESLSFSVASTGTATAPYVWIAIPTVQGVNIKSVTDVTTGSTLTPITYDGGVWFQLSSAGITSGQANPYKINFEYTSCVRTSFNVTGGWNCGGYPASPNDYPCNLQPVSFSFVPQLANVQIEKVSEPTVKYDLCSDIPVEYAILSAGSGNVKDPRMVLLMPTGLKLPGTIEVQYPYGTGSWEVVPFTTNNNEIIVDVTKHSMYPANGLPGTINDGANSNTRKIGVRFSVKTDCGFSSGSTFGLRLDAKSTCGQLATGSGVVVQSAPITINGAEADYRINTVIKNVTSFNNCASLPAVTIEHTIISNAPIGNTGKINVEIPAGYEYSTITCTSTKCPTYAGTEEDSETSKRYAKFIIPEGMVGGETLNYTVSFQKVDSGGACGSYTGEVRTFDLKSLTCSTTGQVCPALAVSTSSAEYSYSIVKPVYTIDQVSGSLSGGALSGKITVSNTSQLNADNKVKIKFYCVDTMGQKANYIGSHTFTVAIASAVAVTEQFNISTAVVCPGTQIIAEIDSENCVCSETSKIFSTVCYNDPNTGAVGLPVNHGITLLQRAGDKNGNWPMNRSSAYTALESNTKGFIVTRIATADLRNITNPVEGMMVYDTTAKCLKIYVVDSSIPANTGWKCFSTPACP